jgi:hypothetical protein
METQHRHVSTNVSLTTCQRAKEPVVFGKKPATTKAPWAIRVLTPDFLIDGYHDTEAHPESWPFFTPQSGSPPEAMLWLASPRFTPVAAGAVVPPPVTNWLLPYNGSFVAVMPFDDASLAGMQKNASREKYPFPAVLYVGPFTIRGQLLSPYQNPAEFAMIAGHLNVVVVNAEFEYRLPGAQFTGLKTPLALVRTQLLQGFGLAS